MSFRQYPLQHFRNSLFLYKLFTIILWKVLKTMNMTNWYERFNVKRYFHNTNRIETIRIGWNNDKSNRFSFEFDGILTRLLTLWTVWGGCGLRSLRVINSSKNKIIDFGINRRFGSLCLIGMCLQIHAWGDFSMEFFFSLWSHILSIFMRFSFYVLFTFMKRISNCLMACKFALLHIH